MTELGKRLRQERESGAALVEFAVLMPLLLLLVLGIVDFGWALTQQLDVRHGAREASRLVAVDEFDLIKACDRMDLADGATIGLSGFASGVAGTANITVTAPLTTPSGFFASWLPSTISSDVAVRIEQPPTTWADGVQPCPP